jgi:hypothetical protein
MFPFILNPYIDEPPNYLTVLDCRSHPGSPISRRQSIGDGATHHDILNFSLTRGSENVADTLVVRHHVRACHFTGLSTAIVKLLLADLLDLQDERRFALGIAALELPAREQTIRTMEEVLEARAEWALDEGGEKKKDEGQKT